MVRIDSGKLDADTPFRAVSKSQWPDLVRIKGDQIRQDMYFDCRGLISICEEAEDVYAEIGYQSAADMIRQGYELDPKEIDLAVAWLKHNNPDEKIGIEEVRVELGRVGRPKKGEEKDRNPTLLKRGREYDLARLRRDRPDLAAKVEAGELSANAAAIEAGFRKKRTPLDDLTKAWGKASRKQQDAFLRAHGLQRDSG